MIYSKLEIVPTYITLYYFVSSLFSSDNSALGATVDEHLAELMPIFEQIRAQEQVPCAFPLHMGAGGTVFLRNTSRLVSLSPHTAHCHPSTHWVSFV